jgi:transposase
LSKWLETEALLPQKQRRTAMRLYEGLVAEGYAGAYDSIRRFVQRWKADNRNMPSLKQAFVPLVFKPGEVCQFDWSQEVVELGGVEQVVRAAHFRLCYSRKMFVVAYLREAQEMLIDAHNKAFAFFGGVTLQMIYDNPKTIVDTVLTGKERKFNRRFMALANQYLFEPVACTPAAPEPVWCMLTGISTVCRPNGRGKWFQSEYLPIITTLWQRIKPLRRINAASCAIS